MRKKSPNTSPHQAEPQPSFFSKPGGDNAFFSGPAPIQLQPKDKKDAEAPVVDACKNSNSAEASWATTHPGGVFGVEDNLKGPKASDELIFWNYCVGESAMRTAHRQRLNETADRWVKLLQQDTSLKVKLQGAASTSGNADANKALALERAQVIRDFLISKKIPAGRIEIDDVSTPRSLAPETSPDNMARNRRVELYLFRPTPVVNKLPPWVDVDIQHLQISQPAKAGDLEFDPAGNSFVRTHFGMAASADITLTSLGGTGVGFSQVLYEDTLMAQYRDPKTGQQLVLDYGNCNLLPCKDLNDATSQFSVDSTSLFLAAPGSVTGAISMSDRPGAVFPLKYPDAKGAFELNHYFWLMRFVVILGAREMGAFIPLRHAFWNVVAQEDVDVSHRTTNGLSPISIIGAWQNGMAPGFDLEAIYAGPTCRYVRRSEQSDNKVNVCRPMVTFG